MDEKGAKLSAIGDCEGLVGDFKSTDERAAPVAQVKAMAPDLGVLVNNAGLTHIINTGAMGGIGTQMAGANVYLPLKAALHHLMRGLSRDLGADSILVTLIAPGFFNTGRAVRCVAREGPAQMVGNADDIASAAAGPPTMRVEPLNGHRGF